MPRRNDDDTQDDATIDDTQDDSAATAGGGDHGGNPPPPQPDTQFAGMNDRERALVERARAEEKRKLYKKQEQQAAQITDLTRQIAELRTAPPPPSDSGRQNRDDRLDRLTSAVEGLVESNRQTNDAIAQMRSEEDNRRRRVDLDRFQAALIADVRRAGHNVIEALVGGDTEEQIEDSVKIARAEWFITVEEDRKKHGRGNGGQPASVTVQTGRRPAGTPPVQTPNTVEADDHENIDELTSQDAVRDGTYKENRSKLWGRLKRTAKYAGQPST